MKQSKYLGVLFTSEGITEQWIGWSIREVVAVLHFLYRSVLMTREMNQKAKLIFIPSLTYGHEGKEGRNERS